MTSSRQKELRDAISELNLVKEEVCKLNARKIQLEDIISSLKSSIVSDRDPGTVKNRYDRTDFTWSKKLQEKLVSVFSIKQFRSLQLSAINATMSNEG